MSVPSVETRVAEQLGVALPRVAAAVRLIDEGASVPFIARYRKEATGGLDDTQLRTLEERLAYLRELDARRIAILAAIEAQGKLDPALRAAIEAATDKARLEDLYLPYRQKRRTKAQIAREAGLEALADALLADPSGVPEAVAASYLRAPFTTADGIDHPGVPDAKAALDGARQILMERFAEDADLISALRAHLTEHAVLRATVVDGRAEAGAKFADYFDYTEPLARIPSHRALALLRGRREEVLSLSLRLADEPDRPDWNAPHNRCEQRIAAHAGVRPAGGAADKWLADTVRWTWRVKIALHLESELLGALRERAEEEAIRVFGANLKDLLLAPPAGPRATMGLDPGLRTGVKVAVVDATGRLVDTATVYPHEPRRDWQGALAALASLVRRHRVELVAIGNGTASRETDRLAAELVSAVSEAPLAKVLVSEAGASVYSASASAAREFPELDVSLRGAVSIARRLQDPLAELVKIEPKAIGVGQYQHDVNQSRLSRALDAVVEDCVNGVGVDLNTASVPLLSRVSGLNAGLAGAIVAWRDANGRFAEREQLRLVPRLGDKAFEQCAGFLRIRGGSNPLDASGVHPEAYGLVRRILADLDRDIAQVIGDAATLRRLAPTRYADAQFGLPTVEDVLKELEKPGRDPRPQFVTARFHDGVTSLSDLRPGMLLEGVVSNVANFGAFVDIGVHQDGLVHVSALSERFVRDPREVVRAGQVVKVRVVDVDVKRGRVALTMRLRDAPDATQARRGAGAAAPVRAQARRPDRPAPGGALAQAWSRALRQGSAASADGD
ncbi:MAG: RNA-binding transcriptional accessory protein [Burkholderiales bacterium]|nr:RNA-binding transcriptional accessory protein [Burkholderiales bacterium]